MSLSAFLHLLVSKAFYFSLATELPDAWEGIVSQELRSNIHSLFEGADAKDADAYVRIAQRLLRKGVGILCWHMNDYESIAMWKLYTAGGDGVAITTTVGRLIHALDDVADNVYYVGSVEYTDHFRPAASERQMSIMQPLFQKRKSFSHESELRAVVTRDGFLQKTKGESFPLRLESLIERVVVSPEYPLWALPSLQSIVTQAGLNITVETSDVLKRPDLLDKSMVQHN